MKSSFHWLRWAWVVACAAVLVGCGSQSRDRLVHVFFTGVDQPVVASASTNSMPVTNSGPSSLVNNAVPAVFFHKPFAERNCVGCHQSDKSQKLKAEGADLCLTCHDKLIGEAKVVHSPVDDGKCHLCHDPHQSKQKSLLIRVGRDVCLNCHRMAKMEKVKGHANMGTEAACQSCHDPHKSNLKKLLKAPAS